MLPNIGQTKSKKKIKWFENPEIDEEPLLTFNRRTHSHVSDIEYYEELISKSHSPEIDDRCISFIRYDSAYEL